MKEDNILLDHKDVPLISFICVDYNSFLFTKKFCESLLSQRGLDDLFKVKLVVVDNFAFNTTNRELENYCREIDWIEYVLSASNLGYFGGLNLGLERTLKHNSKYVVICNNDLEFDVLFCAKLIAKNYDETVQAVCPDVVTIDGVHQNPHRLVPITRLGVLAFDFYFSSYVMSKILIALKRSYCYFKPKKYKLQRLYTSLVPVHQGVGAIYILTKAFLDENTKLFFPFFLYGEEVLISWQIHSSGGVLVYDPDLVVKHAESATLSKLPTKKTYGFARDSYWGLRKYMCEDS